MKYPKTFIAATEEYCVIENHIPAPLIRKNFAVNGGGAEATVLICGLGFYELRINGIRVSKLLAPYISAPDDVIYYDLYDITEHLRLGENVIGIILGNGMQNAFGGTTWAFDKAHWRGAPKVALRLDISYIDGGAYALESDQSFKASPSPICFDELRCGEYYDARLELHGWDLPGFNDSDWQNVLIAPTPRGEPRLCAADPIIVACELRPVTVERQEDGWLYDFGENCAGVCRLRINGSKGQKIIMTHGELLVNGKLDVTHISFFPKGYFQKDIYICKGGGVEEYTPKFTYHGFQYVFIEGVTEEQATNGLLTYLVMHSDLKERGGFSCSDEVANTLQALTRRSTLANFFYFPTDCPQREKNGWTGDAAVSAEHTLLNLEAEVSYIEWLRNIRKAQKEDGQLPGVVPTGGWGYEWGNGPAWDCVLTYLPYYTYVYRGNRNILKENGTAIFRYLHYISGLTRQKDGLVEAGLGDWCPPGRRVDDYKAPLIVTDSIISMDICRKAEFIFKTLSWDPEMDFAHRLYESLRLCIRENLIDFDMMVAMGNCQTSQAMALYHGVFDDAEKPTAFK